MEVKKEINTKEETTFVKCRELEVSREDLINIYLLDAILLQPEQRSPWIITVVDPDGFIVGEGGLPRWDAPAMEFKHLMI